MSPPRPIIVEDSAEQTPLRFSNAVDVVRGSLWTGDYGIVAPDVGEYVTRRRKPRKADAPPPGFPALLASGVGEHVATVERPDGTTVRLALLPLRVERKSLPDLVACCTRERERFEGVLSRMAAAFRPGRAVIVVEATYDEIEAGVYRSRTIPASVIGSMIAWHLDYGIPTLTLGTPGNVARWTERWLTKALERHIEAAKVEAEERAAIAEESTA